jgi:hypothetical protein
MLGYFRNLFDSGARSPRKGGPLLPEPRGQSRPGLDRGTTQQTYTKVFRYRLPDGQTTEPATVEVVGSFTHWRPVPLNRDGKLDSWHVILHHIPGNRTHHYMLLVDGRPTYDATCDGLAVPHGTAEEQYQLVTEKGGRVLMLFAQTR